MFDILCSCLHRCVRICCHFWWLLLFCEGLNSILMTLGPAVFLCLNNTGKKRWHYLVKYSQLLPAWFLACGGTAGFVWPTFDVADRSHTLWYCLLHVKIVESVFPSQRPWRARLQDYQPLQEERRLKEMIADGKQQMTYFSCIISWLTCFFLGWKHSLKKLLKGLLATQKLWREQFFDWFVFVVETFCNFLFSLNGWRGCFFDHSIAWKL